MALKLTALWFLNCVAYILYLTHALVVNFVSSLRVYSRCQRLWLKLTDMFLFPWRVAATATKAMYCLPATLCRSGWQVLSSTGCWILSPMVHVTSIGHKAPQAIAAVGATALDFCCTKTVSRCRHCACTLCQATSKLVYAPVGAFSYSLLGVGQFLRCLLPDTLVCTYVAVVRVLNFFWCKFLDNNASENLSNDVSHKGTQKQTVKSSTVPPKTAATINIHSNCGAHQIIETLIVKVAQLASLGWDQKIRSKWASICGRHSYEGFWDMVPCTFNAAYRQLAPHYPEELSLIGRGAMGKVFYAETQDDFGNWVPCAVKCQPYSETNIKEIVDKEVAVLEVMSGSAHTLTLMSHGTALLEGQMHKYIATRYLETVNMESILSADLAMAIGEDLDNRLSAILVAFEGIIQGVADMHNAGWAHLDIKPANICMELKPGTSGGHSYVIDYGSALKIGSGSYDILSTWWFAAPEVLAYNMTPCEELLDKVNFQGQDAWSLGCVLIWLLMGHDPFSLSNEDCAELDIRDANQCQQALRKRQLAWYKRRKGNSEVFVSTTVQRFTQLVREKQHPVLDRLHELASHLLTHRRSARCTAGQALDEVKMLISMKSASL